MQSGWLDEFAKQQKSTPVSSDDAKDTTQNNGVSRRDFIQHGVLAGVAAGIAADATLAQAQPAQPQQTARPVMTPIGPPWWPSKWGAQDEAGASNLITPAKILETVKLIKTGKTYELGRVYE